MKRIAVIAVIAAVLAVGLGATAPTPASARVTASQLVTVQLQLYPKTCRQIRFSVNTLGYRWALREFKSGYGKSKSPAAAAVFYVLVRRCYQR